MDAIAIEEQLKSKDVEERRAAVLGLKGLPSGADEKTVIGLLVLAMRDTSWRVRKTAQDIIFEEYPVESYIDGLVSLLYIEDNAGARNAAIETLTRLNKKVTPFLVSAFETPNADVRKFIIDVLGQFKDKRALPLLLGALKDEDDNVRASAVEHLGVIGEASVVDAIIGILEEGELWTAYPAADALGRIGDKRALPALVKALERKALREPALKAIGMLGDADSLKHVIPFIEDKSKVAAEEAIKVMEVLYRRGVNEQAITGELKRILGDRVIDLLKEHAWSPKPEVRVSAILLLGILKDERALNPLLELSVEPDFAEDVRRALVFIGNEKPEALLPLFEKNNPHLRRFSASAASVVAAQIYFDVFKKMLEDDDGHVRAIAAEGLANIGDLRAVGLVKGLLKDRYLDVQEAAISALGKLKSGVSVHGLLEGISSKDPILRKNIVILLGVLRAQEAVEELGFALKDGDVAVRRSAVASLSAIGTREAIKYITSSLTDEDPDIRASAALSLGSAGDREAIEPLSLLLSDPDTKVKVAAARALGMLADRRALPGLIKMLSDNNGFVVTTAMDSLGKIGGEEAKRALSALLSSSDIEVRRSAIKALSSLGGLEESIVPFLSDPDWATRVAAVEALGPLRDIRIRSRIEKLYDEEEDPAVRRVLERYVQ